MGAAAAGLLAGCGNSAASSSTAASTAAGTYTAGTYSATATGINTATPVTVTMTFSADAITDVQIDVANETKGYGADIADEMVKKILDAQSSEVDGHSGATITSDAIRKAAESCINQAKGVAVAPTEANKAETVVPDGLSVEEVESSVCELGDITPDETKDFDVVVVGAGAAGVPAAGWAAELGGHVALLQKQSIVVSQGNCGSAIIKSKSTDAGKKMWVHMTNGLCDWRADTSLLNAYVENSEEALMWYLNRAGLTDQTEYGDGSLVDSNKNPSDLLHNDEKEIFAYMCTSQDLTGVWKDRMDTYDFGDEHCYFFAPWIGPKPKNVGDVLATVLENVQAKNSNLEAFFNTPAVKLVHDERQGDRRHRKGRKRQVHPVQRFQGRHSGHRRLHEQRGHGQALVPRCGRLRQEAVPEDRRRPHHGHRCRCKDGKSGPHQDDARLRLRPDVRGTLPVCQHGGQALLQRGHRLCLHGQHHQVSAQVTTATTWMQTIRTVLWAGTARSTITTT